MSIISKKFPKTRFRLSGALKTKRNEIGRKEAYRNKQFLYQHYKKVRKQIDK